MGQHRIDCQVLICHEPKPWIYRCLESLEGEPVNVKLSRGIDGHVGKSRAKNFRRMNAEFYAFVDADDYVKPGAFAECLKVFDSKPEVVGVFCDLEVIDGEDKPVDKYTKSLWNPMQQIHNPAFVHHLHVFRAEAVRPYLDLLECFESNEEQLLCNLAANHGPFFHIPKPLYVFRQHRKYRRAGHLMTPQLMRKVLKVSTRGLMDMHRQGIRQIDYCYG